MSVQKMYIHLFLPIFTEIVSEIYQNYGCRQKSFTVDQFYG